MEKTDQGLSSTALILGKLHVSPSLSSFICKIKIILVLQIYKREQMKIFLKYYINEINY